MKRHLRNHAWLYILLIVLVAWPVAIWHITRLPPLDEGTVQRMQNLLVEKFQREHPDRPFVRDPAPAIDSQIGVQLGLVSELYGQAAGMEALAPELAQVQNDPSYRALNAWLHRPVALDPMVECTGFSDTLKIARAEIVSAVSAMRQEHWDQALQHLQSAAHTGDVNSHHDLFGVLMAIAFRSIAYDGYRTMLHFNPPPEVERKALDALVGLRASDPVFDSEVILSCWFQDVPSSVSAAKVDMADLVFLAAFNLASHSEQITNPHLKSVENRIGIDPNNSKISYLYDNPDQTRWTAIIERKRWLQEMIAAEPWTYEQFGLPKSDYAGLDHWTLALLAPENNFFASAYRQSAVEMRSRARTMITEGRLVEAAYAARLYQHEHGAWPQSIDQLTSIYPPPTAAAPDQGPYLPLRIATLPLNDDLRAALWEQLLPLKANLAKGTWQFAIFDTMNSSLSALNKNGELHFNISSELGHYPSEFIAVAQAFALHPALVAGPVVVQQRGSDSAGKPMLQPLDLAEAQRITEENLKAGINKGKPIAVALTVDLRAPAQAVVIWSPGPDGKDDGGKVVYDTTNGTNSGGDMVVFAEGF